MKGNGSYWIEHCAKPRERPAGILWDVFISYRSADRVWAMALHDMFRQAGYTVFLDQFVLVPGGGLASQIARNLAASASGALVWSSRAEDSKWVESEYDAMVQRAIETKDSSLPFFFVPLKIDQAALPTLLEGKYYIDFSGYPDGPTGAELVRLAFGLQGQPLNEGVVARIADAEEEMRQQPSQLRGMSRAGQFDAIRDRALGGGQPYLSSAVLAALAAQLLIDGGRYADALAVIDEARQRFPRSVRLRQLRGLAFRRARRTNEALIELETLCADGHRDSETLGILAAAWTQRWEETQDPIQLEHARDLYREAYTHTPTDTYVGINAASKSAMLGELVVARDLARKVLKNLADEEAQRELKKLPPADYWKRATEPEALLLLGEFERAFTLFRAARVAHLTELGSFRSTAAQLARLLKLDFVPEDWKTRFLDDWKDHMPQAQ